MTDGRDRLPLAEQMRLIGEIVRMATVLQERGDPFLFGHYLHLRERAEMLRDVVEPICPGEPSSRPA